jgi:hypothetical protein
MAAGTNPLAVGNDDALTIPVERFGSRATRWRAIDER